MHFHKVQPGMIGVNIEFSFFVDSHEGMLLLIESIGHVDHCVDLFP